MRINRPRHPAARLCAGVSLLAVAGGAPGAQQRDHSQPGPVPVRYAEATVHGFLELRTPEDRLLASGDLLQTPKDDGIESRLILRFVDKSRFEETTRFSQRGVFRLESYHLVQQGSAFSADLDATLSRDGRYRVESVSHKDGHASRYEGKLELPEDVSNGLPVVLAKNLRPGDTAMVHLVAFMPKPRLIGLQIAPAGGGSAMLGARTLPTTDFVVKPKLGALTGFFAKLLGKMPPDSHIWIVTDQLPAFIQFEGPMYSGPVWRLSTVTPRVREGAGPRPR